MLRQTRVWAMAALLLGLWVIALPSQAQTRVYRPGSKVAGKKLSRWADLWWKLVYETPGAQCQILDPDGRFANVGQKGPVYFLFGTFGGDVERTVTIKGEKHIFFPMLNYENDPYVFGDPNAPYNWTIDEVRAIATANIDAGNYLDATVDGVPVTKLRYVGGGRVTNLFDHREQTDKPFFYTLPGNNEDIASLLAGDTRFSGMTLGPAVSDGYWLMLEPLRPGKHVITFAGGNSFGFSLHIRYNITVVKGDDCDD